MNCRSIGLFACFVLTTPLSAQDKREHLLRMSFPTRGVQFHRKTLAMETKVADATVRTVTMAVTLETTVTAVAEGKTSLEQTVRRIVRWSNHRSERSYDSDDGGEDPQGFGTLVGMSFHMKVDDHGRTSDFKAPDVLPANAANDAWYIQAIQFAEAPIGIGRTWEAGSTMAFPGTSRADVVLVHKLTAVDKGRATVETQVKVDRDKLEMPPGMTIEKNSGTAVIELATGKLLESRSELVCSVSGTDGTKTVTTMTTSVQAIEPPAKPSAGKAEPKGGKD